MQGQTDFLWDLCGDLRFPVSDSEFEKGRTWDVQLALALLDATAGTSLAGPFWNSYAFAFPPRKALTIPFALPCPKMLDELQSPQIKAAALAQRERLNTLFPSLVDSVYPSHQLGNVDLLWSFAMVRSRCFVIAKDYFAMVPVIDMANHCLEPSSSFTIIGAEEDVQQATCVLKASRDICEGEEVTICYDASYSNQRLMQQYGFIDSGNPNHSDLITFSNMDHSNNKDDELFSNCDARVLDMLAESAFQLSLDGDGGKEQYQDFIEPVTRCLAARIKSINFENEKSIQEQLAIIKKEIDASYSLFPTTLETDLALLESVESVSEDKMQFLACLRFRVDKKKALQTASLIVSNAINNIM